MFLVKQKVHAAKIEAPFPERYRCPLQSAPVRTEVILRQENTTNFVGIRKMKKTMEVLPHGLTI